MKIKNGLLMEEDFMPAFEELLLKDLPAKQCLELAEALDDIAKKAMAVQRARRAIVEKYAQKGEDGQIKSRKDNPDKIDFGTKENEEKCAKEIVDLFNEEYDVPLSSKVTIKSSDVSTGRKMLLLRDIVEIEEPDKKEEE